MTFTVHPKAEVSDKKERANARVGVRSHKAQLPFPSPPSCNRAGHPQRGAQCQFFSPSPSCHDTSVQVVRVPPELGGWLILFRAWCPQCPLLSSLWRWPGEETWSVVANVKPLIRCWKNISQGVWSRNCHLVSFVAVLSDAAGAALINACSQCRSGQSKNTGLQYLGDLVGKV